MIGEAGVVRPRARRRLVRFVQMSVAAGLFGAATARADRVELRGGEFVEGTVVEASPAGLSVRRAVSGGAALESVDRFSWDRVRSVDAANAPMGLKEWLEVGEKLWRARIRLERGDVASATEILGDLPAKFVGESGATPLVAALASLQVMEHRGDRAAALAAMLEATRLKHSGVAMPSLAHMVELAPDGHLRSVDLFDPATGLCPRVPPFAGSQEEAARMLAVTDGFRAHGDPASEELRRLYASILDPGRPAPSAPDATQKKHTDATTEGAARAQELLHAFHDSMDPDPAVREKGREAISQLRRRMPDWADGWGRYQLGLSLLAEADPAQRTRGVVQLMHLPARFAAEQPWLAQAAGARAAAESVAAGRADEALAIRNAIAALSNGSSTARGPRGAAAIARDADDQIAEWLDRNGLERLLATLLEDRLSRDATEAERRDTAKRLADLLSRRLDGSLAPEERDAITNTAKVLKPFLAQVDADSLNLAILRSRYRPLAKTAEEHRMGRATKDDAARVREELKSMLPEFEGLRRRLESELKNDDRKLDRSVGIDAETILETVDRKRGLVDTSRFFQAWSSYYLGWLERRSAPDKVTLWKPHLDQAHDLFRQLLDTGKPDPAPADVSADRRGDESYASALLGASLAKAILLGAPKADPWFDVVADGRTAQGVRKSAQAWRIAGHMDAGDYEGARLILAEAAKKGEVPAAWLRLAAAEALGAEALLGGVEPRGASDLAQTAVAQLAAQGELAEVLDLASRFPAGKLPIDGFVGRYVRGVRLYEEARKVKEKGGDPKEAFQSSATALLGAVQEPDASKFPQAQAGARQLAGWSLVGVGDYAGAAEAFEQAAEGLPPTKAAESLWLAASAAGRAANDASGEARKDLEKARRRVIDRLVTQHPESEFAARASIVRIHADGGGEEELHQLLAVPPGSSAYADARAEAQEILYRLYRNAPDTEKKKLGVRYLETATTDVAAPGAARLTCLRRRLEIAVAPGVDRADDAMAARTEVESRARDGEFSLDGLADELMLRDLQIAAMRSNFAVAQDLLAKLQKSADPRWVRSGRRALFRAATASSDSVAAAAAIDAGSAVLAEPGATFEDPAMATVALGMARSAFQLAQQGDTARAHLGFDVIKTLIGKKPRDAKALEVGAALAEALNEDLVAAEWLRTLVGAAAQGDPTWFSAKVHLVRLLLKSDPRRALTVLDQHHALMPDWGPSPWGEQLKALDMEARAKAPGGAL